MKHGVSTECGGSREMRMGSAGYILANGDTKKWFCGRSYILLMELGGHPMNMWKP